MNRQIRAFAAGAAVIAVLWVLSLAVGGGETDATSNAPASAESASEVTIETQDTEATAETQDPEATQDTAAVDEAEPTPEPEAEPAADAPAETARFSDLDVVAPAELPIEAIDTLALIADGGPYPFDQDDGTFQNREGILPERPRGHYREYTVITPGEDDRGARRIVSGADGELYYTDDHYDSFREIVVDS